MRWLDAVVVTAALSTPAFAHADSVRADLEAASYAWGGSDSAHPGAQLAGAVWLGPFGLVLEGSRQSYREGGSMSAYGIGARLGLAELPTASEETTLSLWGELGAAREHWDLGGASGARSLERRRLHAGGGFSYINPVSEPFHIGAVVWLRGQFAEEASKSAVARRTGRPAVEGPRRRAVVFGAGFLAGW